MTRTPMTRLPWLIRSRFFFFFFFLVPRKFFRQLKIANILGYFRIFFQFHHEMYFVSTHYNRLIGAILMSTHKISLFYSRSKRHPYIISIYLLPGAMVITLNGSNYPYLEQSSMVPKMFEPVRFDCILKAVVYLQVLKLL